MVVILPRRGTLVSELDVADLQEIFELRVELEGLSARLAGERAREAERASLQALIERTRASLASGDQQALIELDRELHAAIAEHRGQHAARRAARLALRPRAAAVERDARPRQRPARIGRPSTRRRRRHRPRRRGGCPRPDASPRAPLPGGVPRERERKRSERVMGQKVDAVIIGAGVIGTATAFELCKRGYKTLNIDKLPVRRLRPTSNSCAIVRAHYSSFDGVAMAYEGFFYWKKWAEYLERRGRVRAREVHDGRHRSARERDRPPRQGAAALRPPRRPVRGVGHRDARTEGADLRRARVLAAVAARRTTTSQRRARRSCRARSTRPTPATSTTRRSRRTTCSAPPRPTAASSSTAAR